ncbi:quinone oxidoreductase-like [Ptychodera flava]|uniref:quinone oxidoreductase-like n=1 Tax=Ptychodera flava TaxID=63121 RepID=UPI00396A19BE
MNHFVAIFRSKARASETVLIHGASGAVGIACLQLGSAYGLNLMGTAGTPKGLELIAKHGAQKVFNHREEGYTKQIMEATGGKGVDASVPRLPKEERVTFTQGDLYLCLECKQRRFPTARKKSSDDAANATTPPDTAIMHINNQLTDIHTQLRCLPALQSAMQEVQETQKTISTSLEFFNNIVEELKGKVESLETKNIQLLQRNENLEKRLTELEREVEEQNQYSRRGNLELHGILKSLTRIPITWRCKY